jgi:hypothetical protein
MGSGLQYQNKMIDLKWVKWLFTRRKENSVKTTIASLPSDLVREIASFLDPFSLESCSLLNKHFSTSLGSVISSYESVSYAVPATAKLWKQHLERNIGRLPVALLSSQIRPTLPRSV